MFDAVSQAMLVTQGTWDEEIQLMDKASPECVESSSAVKAACREWSTKIALSIDMRATIYTP